MLKKKAEKLITVPMDVKFTRCPNKKHPIQTAMIMGGPFDGFIRPGCVCAAELLVMVANIELGIQNLAAKKKGKKKV